MNSDVSTIKQICAQRENIAAYIEGELPPREEFEFEAHAAVCESCRDELNEQKKLLCALDCALEQESEIELPANFTKVVVANAESKVSGLRRPQERFKALFVCAVLLILGLLFLGGETEAVFGAFAKFAEQMFAVGGFVAHIIYDVSIGVAVILRSLSGQFALNLIVSAAFLIGLTCAATLALSRLVVRQSASE